VPKLRASSEGDMIDGSVRWLEREGAADYYLASTFPRPLERVLQVRHVEWYLPGGGGTGETVSTIPFQGFLQRWSGWQDVPIVKEAT